MKPRGITVTAVCPGWVDTGMLPREKNGRPIKYIGMVKPDVVVKKSFKGQPLRKRLVYARVLCRLFQILLQDYPHKTGYETMGIDNEEVCVTGIYLRTRV